jgi:SPP1 gp7 family putative phage head morphogenesis protein
MSEETLSKAELTLIDKIIGSLGLSSFRDLLWKKVEKAFRFTFKNTQVNYGFAHATPDPLALKYLEERVLILSDKTRDRLTGNMRWELLEGIRNTESISDIKKRLDKVFTGMHDYEIERIARTETLNAMNAGRLEAYKVSEVTHYKMWRAAINNKRTAADSKRLHGQIQELGDPFVDPKTGEGVMHPPNRPNCRCTMIPLRKLPENVVRKGGQMYAADEMVGKIEIDIWSLSKSEKRVWVKPTVARKGHYRKIKGEKKVEEKISISDGIYNIDDIIDPNDFEEQIKSILSKYSWNIDKSDLFNYIRDYRGVDIHIVNSKIYAVSNVTQHKRYKSVKINGLEVNSDMRRSGYGIKVMADIVQKYIDDDDCEILELESGGDNSDKFYDAIGMKREPGRGETMETTNRYIGDKEWMKKFMKSISKKQ